MSITGISEQDKIHKKPFHRRNDSGELDVFEAARYFSGATEVSGYNNCVTYTQKVVRDEKQGWRGGRISVDVSPVMRSSIPSQMENHQIITKEKKHKQPRSPGGRLASFLNSLFNHQTSSKKKKSKSTTTQSVKDEDESPGGRRKRRSSISHFRTASATDSSNKSIYSSSSSGFRTPPPLSHTPTKTTYRDLRSYSDHKPKYNIGKSTALPNDICDEKFKLTNGFSEKYKNSGNGFPEKFKNSGNGFSEKMDGFSKFNEVGGGDDDDGAESDSSSDLFELENYDLGYYSSGLPVYETTHMDSIKRGAPISNGLAI